MKARYLSLDAFIPWQQSERPIAWSRRFEGEAPLEVEIGFGNGEYLVRNAINHPERHYVGIELEWASLQRGLRKIAQANLLNIRLLQANAAVALERLFCPEAIDRIYALFPCPWPKARHVKHRLFSHSFLKLLNSRLKIQGELQIVTDHQGYATWLQEQIPATGFDYVFQPVSAGFCTKYERKWQAQGQDQFFELSLRKKQHMSIPVQKDEDLQIHRVEVFNPDQFQPQNIQGDIAIAFKDFVYDPKRQRAMQWVFVAEDNLGQDVWIDIACGGDYWYIRPTRGCPFVPTKGVQRALDLIRDTISAARVDSAT